MWSASSHSLLHSSTVKPHTHNAWTMFLLLPDSNQRHIQSRLLSRGQSDGLSLLKLHLFHRPYTSLHCPWLASKSGKKSLWNWKLRPFFFFFLYFIHSMVVYGLLKDGPCSFTLSPWRLKTNPAYFPDVWLHLGLHWICRWHLSKLHVTITITRGPLCVISSPQSWIHCCLNVWVQPCQEAALPLSEHLLSLCRITTAAINIKDSLSIWPWLFLTSSTAFCEDHHPLLCVPSVRCMTAGTESGWRPQGLWCSPGTQRVEPDHRI